MVLWVKIITVNNKLHFYTYVKIHYISKICSQENFQKFLFVLEEVQIKIKWKVFVFVLEEIQIKIKWKVGVDSYSYVLKYDEKNQSTLSKYI